MPDLITGVAILDRSTSPETLHFYRKSGDKPKCSESIPVYPKGAPKPCDPCWQYEIDGELLHCSPSVWVKYEDYETKEWRTLFHNSGKWDVRFRLGVEADLRPANES